jgi:hypothetical protein
MTWSVTMTIMLASLLCSLHAYQGRSAFLRGYTSWVMQLYSYTSVKDKSLVYFRVTTNVRRNSRLMISCSFQR